MRRRAALAAFLSGSALPAFAQAYGSAEGRAIAEFRSDRWPSIERAIIRAAGYELPVEVDWDSLALPGKAPRYETPEYLGLPIFGPLVEALSRIAPDEGSQAALRRRLSRIVVRFDRASASGTDYPAGLSFRDGVLTINWEPDVNPGDAGPRTAALVAALDRRS